VYKTGTGTDVCLTEIVSQLNERIENKVDTPLYILACPAWVKYAEPVLPFFIPLLSTVKFTSQITGVLIKTLVADQLGVKPAEIFSCACNSLVWQ